MLVHAQPADLAPRAALLRIQVVDEDPGAEHAPVSHAPSTPSHQVRPLSGPRPSRPALSLEVPSPAWDKGGLGLQLDSGARIVIRRKYGGPMIYYRTTF